LAASSLDQVVIHDHDDYGGITAAVGHIFPDLAKSLADGGRGFPRGCWKVQRTIPITMFPCSMDLLKGHKNIYVVPTYYIVSSNGSLSMILIDYLDSNRWGNHHKTCYTPNPRLDPEVLQQRNLIGRLYRAAEKRAKSSHLGLRDPDAQAAGAETWR